MEICVLSINYPTEKHHIHVFLDNLVRMFVDKGIKCNVIAPQSRYSYFAKKELRREVVSERFTENGNKYKVYSPLYNVYPRNRVLGFSLSDLSKKSFYKAAKKVYIENSIHADVIYSHFLQAGIPAVMLAKDLNLPVFIANGEADTISETKYISRKLIQETLEGATGIISVSTKCKEEISALCGGDERIMQKVTIIPNAANSKRFYKMERHECRAELGIPDDYFVIAFTGSFIERKGIKKVENAVESVEGVYPIFIGEGPEMPKCRNILFCGKVKNEVLGKYLNAADVFVLPTLAEGCSNAVVEAVSCGLPIISSNRSFNWDVLDEACSILIDPENQEELNNAISFLRDDLNRRKELELGSIKRAEELSLQVRANRILDFIEKASNKRTS